jgi:2-methylisocitrate lyase-like PEP mutase family enzyme
MQDAFEDATRRKRLKFRELLARKTLTVMPGGFGPIYARAAEMAGFECFFVAGSQMSAYLLGVPDTGVIGLRDMVDHARHVAARTEIPIFLDGDTGFGNATNVHFTVQECVRAGIAGMSIEDQEAPKKSATSAGRRCISADEAIGKYRAAVAARNELDPSFVVCARCDVLGAEGGTFADALARCKAYVTDGGVDLVWLNSAQSREQLRETCAATPAPILTIWGGEDTPPTEAEYEADGVRIVLYPVFTAQAGLQAAWQLLNEVRERGHAALRDWDAQVAKSRWGRVELGKLTGFDKIRALEEKFMPAAAQRDYDTTWGHKTVFVEDEKKS